MMKLFTRASRALLVALTLLTPFAARAASPTSVGITAGSGVSACVFSVTGSLLAPCTVMVDPTTGATIVTANGASATSALGVQGVTGGVALPVSGTFWQSTQPISAASLPLPTGASTAAGLTTINTTLGSPFQAGGSIGNTTFAATESGTWTVQPGNTANTTPWLTTGSITGWAGGTIGTGTIQAFGATEGIIGAGLVPAFNVHITNANGNGSATSANSSPVVIASDQAAVAVKAASGAFASGSLASGALAAGSISSGAAVSGAFAAGAIADLAHGQGTMSASVPVAIASNQSAVPFAPQAIANGGALSSPWLASAASNNATNVKGSAGTLYTLTVTQSTTTAVELKLYNSSSSPTCSSATGLIDIVPIPSNVTSPGVHLTYPVGRAFSTGISFCLVAFGAPAAGTDNGNAVVGITVSMTYD